VSQIVIFKAEVLEVIPLESYDISGNAFFLCMSVLAMDTSSQNKKFALCAKTRT
jgi:hypothetical protein